MPVAIRLLLKRSVVAAFLILSFVLQGTTSVLAGTTGSITGIVTDSSTQKPISGASVSAVSASQSTSTKTDAAGRFTFISLAPDTYIVSVAAAPGRDSYSISG